MPLRPESPCGFQDFCGPMIVKVSWLSKGSHGPKSLRYCLKAPMALKARMALNIPMALRAPMVLKAPMALTAPMTLKAPMAYMPPCPQNSLLSPLLSV